VFTGIISGIDDVVRYYNGYGVYGDEWRVAIKLYIGKLI
jgi:hypothetical protein